MPTSTRTRTDVRCGFCTKEAEGIHACMLVDVPLALPVPIWAFCKSCLAASAADAIALIHTAVGMGVAVIPMWRA